MTTIRLKREVNGYSYEGFSIEKPGHSSGAFQSRSSVQNWLISVDGEIVSRQRDLGRVREYLAAVSAPKD